MYAWNTVFERFDSCFGIVTGTCSSGCFVMLENGEKAFAFNFSHLKKGTEVLCTVLHPAKPERNLDMLVGIDSTLVAEVA
jgi:hypothetical protein